MPLAQALQEPNPEEVAAAEHAETARVLARSQWFNDPFTKAKLDGLIAARNSFMSTAMNLSVQAGKETEALSALRNAAISDLVIGNLIS